MLGRAFLKKEIGCHPISRARRRRAHQLRRQHRLRQEMHVGFAKMHEKMARLETRFERRFGDLIKWSFVFWVGAVGTIAMLFHIHGLRR
jgi:hypothetical protein